MIKFRQTLKIGQYDKHFDFNKKMNGFYFNFNQDNNVIFYIYMNFN